MVDKKTSDTLYVIKSFAVLFVVVAHMSFITPNYVGRFLIADSIRNSLSIIGVPIFFIVSGFFYKRVKGDTKKFWKKKVKALIIPWFLFGIITFVLSALISGAYDNFPLRLIKWTLGIGSWFWYMPVQLALFVLFKFIKKDASLYISIIISIVSVMLTAFGIIPQVPISQYFNIFNWVGFFALGILINRHNMLEKLINVPVFIISFFVIVLSVILMVNFNDKAISYTNYYSLLIELSGFLFCLNISYALSNIKLLKDIGEKSFFIYLVHMQIAGFINSRLPYNAVFFILRPFVALAIVYIGAKITELIFSKLKISKLNFLIGLK